MDDTDNIYFFLDEDEHEDNSNTKDVDFTELFNNLNNYKLESDDNSMNSDNIDLLESSALNYELNYNVKQLLLIGEYYNIAKQLRTNKCNKTEIINTIVLFETDPENFEIMLKRKQLWFYINECKNDKFMKKYVLWFYQKLIVRLAILN